MKSPRVIFDVCTRNVSQRGALLCGWLRRHLKLWRQPGRETGHLMTAVLGDFLLLYQHLLALRASLEWTKHKHIKANSNQGTVAASNSVK